MKPFVSGSVFSTTWDQWGGRTREGIFPTVFWKPAGKLTIKGGPANKSFEKWLELVKPDGGRYDRNSVVADPLFRDFERRDFRLKPGSPALKLGFEPIDTSRIGLKADFPRRLARE